MKKKILYVEISTAHTEIIKSFVDALTPEYEVQLLIHEASIKRVENLSSKIYISTLKESSYLSDILKIKKNFSPDLVLLNSAQGRKIRDLCLRLIFDSTPVVGIHHNAENIYKSFTQKIIHLKVKKYIVLADFIRDFLFEKLKNKKIRVASFYPLSYHLGFKIGFESNDKYILIPGVLEQDRRDYLGLVDLVRRFDSQLDKKLKFVLLGNSKNHNGPRVIEEIQKCKLEARFIFFDRYVEDEMMLSYVNECLAIMPLMHPGTRWFEKYFETKISGAYNLAFAYDKPLLMHEIFRGKKEFEHHAFFYSENNFFESIRLLEKSKIIEKPKKFNLSYQKKILLDFLSS